MPSRRCAAKTCFNIQNCRPNLKFFESPKDEDSYRQWAINSGRLDLLEQSIKFVLCADHFEDSCFLNPKYRTTFIRGGPAPVPSIFRNNLSDFVPSGLQKSFNELQIPTNPNVLCLGDREIGDSKTLLVTVHAERDNLEQESQKLCRLCATPVRETELISISHVTQDSESALDRLARVMPDTVSADDGLPQFACPTCLAKLELCNKTIADFATADTKLRSLFLYDIQMAGTDAWDAFPDSPGDDDLDAVDASSLAVALHDSCSTEDNHIHGACLEDHCVHDSCPSKDNHIDGACLEDHCVHDSCPSKDRDLSGACTLEVHPLHRGCSPSITSPSLAIPADFSLSPPYAEAKAALKCPSCHAGFPTETQLASHQRLHDGEMPHACVACDARFAFRTQLRRHEATHEVDLAVAVPGLSANTLMEEASTDILVDDSTSIPEIASLSILTSHENESNASSGLPCGECGVVFASRTVLRRHERTHRGHACLCCRCGKVLANAASLKVHQRSHSSERHHPCDACPKAFKDAAALLRHKFTHVQHKPFHCSICERSFASPSFLRQHAGSHVTTAHEFRCTRCPAAFSRRGNLVAHSQRCMRRAHQCPTCGKRVGSELTLKYHVSRHTGERLPFGCASCAQRFRSAGTLRTHLRTHSGERPFACTDCARRFRSAGTLRQHAARHREDRPFGCAVCDRRFKRRPSLAVHLRTHTGERPYACTTCQRAFAQRGDLRKHQRTHRELPHPSLEPFALGDLGELLLLELPAVEVEVP